MKKPYKYDTLLTLISEPRFKIRENFFSKLVKKVKVRILIFIILLLFIVVVISLDFNFPKYKSILDNILAGLISSIITIYVIDFLLNYDKKLKNQELNLYNNDLFLLTLRGLMANLLMLFKQVTKEEYKNLLFEKPDRKFSQLVNSPIVQDRFTKLVEPTNDNIAFLITLGDIFQIYTNESRERFEQFIPYPRPDLRQKLKYESNFITAGIIGQKDFLEHNFKVRSKKNRHSVGKSYTKKDFYKLYNQSAYLSVFYNEKFTSEFMKYCNLLIYLVKIAEKKEISFII